MRTTRVSWGAGGNGGRRGREGRGARRGSVLVLIVGVLALMAIVALVFTTIGQTDRRTGAAVVREQRIDDQAQAVGGYISDVLARDVFATVAEAGVAGNGSSFTRLWREASDYPYTDPEVRSELVSGEPWRAPDAAGTMPADPAGDGLGNYDYPALNPRRASDPYLAAEEPSPPVPRGRTLQGGGGPAYDEFRDWAHISNLAPDLRFVNLVALRDNLGAASGIGRDPTTNLPRTTFELTTLRPNGQSYPTTRASRLDDGRTLGRLEVPAHWSNVQKNAFRPMVDTAYLPEDPAYLFNQWADTDGDGYADARWFELVDAQDPDKVRSLLPTAGPARLFVAARVVDLSARINVNTALAFDAMPDSGDAEPTDTNPAGLTPADVDLQGALALRYCFDLYGAAYDRYCQAGAGTASDYSGYTRSSGVTTADDVGRSAFSSLLHAVVEGVPGADPFFAVDQLPESLGLGTNGPLPAVERADLYGKAGRLPGDATVMDGALKSEYGVAFTRSDLLELLTYNGINDPSVTSRLEYVVGGRNQPNQAYSPLRENRPLGPERDDPSRTLSQARLQALTDLRHRLTTVSGSRAIAMADVTSSPDQVTAREQRVDAPSTIREALSGDDATRRARLKDLVLAYADALLPFSSEQKAWDADNTSNPARLLSYARDAELALRLAAGMAVNLVDMYDGGGATGSGADDEPTAVSVAIARDPGPEQIGQYPFADASIDPARRCPTTEAGQLTARKINVFGVEAQPFLVEVDSFTLYTDSPLNPRENENSPITIDGTASSANSDFLFELVAFQLSNPTDRDIELTGANGEMRYYIEYAGNFYKLDEVDESTGAPRGQLLELQAGETRTFYVHSRQSNDAVDARVAASTGAAGFNLTAWMARQFGGTPTPVHIPRVDPATGVLVSDGGALYDVHDEGNPELDRRHAVYLWRVLRPLGNEQSGGPNNQATDYLADRLRDPVTQAGGRGVLMQRAQASDADVTGTTAWLDNNPANGQYDAGEEVDDTGYTIALWSAIRRPTPSAPADYATGVTPPWCLEVRYQTTQTRKFDEGGPGYTGVVSLSDADFAAPHGGFTAPAFFALGPVDADLSAQAELKNGTPIGLNRSTFDYKDAAAQVHRRDGAPLSSMRTGDMLLPLAVAAISDPRATGGTTRFTRLEAQWMTLGEALAMAADYDWPDAATDPYFELGRIDTGAQIDPKVDRGNLVLDRYVPFDDRDNDGAFDAGTELPRGRGIPLALGVLDTFRASKHGSLTNGVAGLMNVNTAPRTNLAELPLLAPDPYGWLGLAGAQLFDPTRDSWDLPTTLTAYRDKTRLEARPIPPQNGTSPYVNFSDRNDAQGDSYQNQLDDNGRQVATAVPGLREGPGFASIGEILCARIHQGADQRVCSQSPATIREDLSIDRLGRDGQALGRGGRTMLGIVNTGYDTNGDGFADANDEIVDDYSERLAIASAVLDTACVRSDVFAVWFVIHGYVESDVTGLKPEDPMVPSIARRYVMVVDRSNVRVLGDRARILLFEELPM